MYLSSDCWNFTEQLEQFMGFCHNSSQAVTHTVRPRTDSETGRCLRLQHRAHLELFNLYYIEDVAHGRPFPNVYNELKRYDDDDFAFRFFLDFDLAMPECDEIELAAVMYAATRLAEHLGSLLDPPTTLDWVVTTRNTQTPHQTLQSRAKGTHQRYFGLHVLFPQLMVCLREQDGYLFNSAYHWMQQWWQHDIVNTGDSHTDHLLVRLAESLDFTNGLAMIAPGHHMPVLGCIDDQLLTAQDFQANSRLLHQCILFTADDWQPLVVDAERMHAQVAAWNKSKNYKCHERAVRMCSASTSGMGGGAFASCVLSEQLVERLEQELRRRFSQPESLKVTHVKQNPDACYVLSTNSRMCSNIGREHRSNHVYFVVNRRGVSQCCFDSDCRCWSSPVKPLDPSVASQLFNSSSADDVDVDMDDGTASIATNGTTKPALAPTKRYRHTSFYYKFVMSNK